MTEEILIFAGFVFGTEATTEWRDENARRQENLGFYQERDREWPPAEAGKTVQHQQGALGTRGAESELLLAVWCQEKCW